jgi:hypothetical protein
VDGQVAEDPEPGLQGDIAERVPSAPPGSFLFCELAAVEGGDRDGQAVRDGVEMTAPPCRGTALFLVSGQGQAAAGEECAQCPPGCAGGRCAAVQELLRAGIGVGAGQPSGLTQDDDRAAGVVARGGEGGEVVPPGRDPVQPAGHRGGVTEGPVRVGQAAPVAQALPGVAPLLAAAGAGDCLGWPARHGATSADSAGA